MAVKGQDLSQQLINIHDVSNVAAMNAISNPNQRSLVYVVDQDLTYQYIGSQWVPHSYESYQNTIDSLLMIVTEVGNIGDSCCGINISSPNIGYAIGDTLGCGVIFYISPDWDFALICSYDNLSSQYGCYSQTTGAVSPHYNGTNATNILITNNCDLGITVDNYMPGNCDDWYVGGTSEMQRLFIDNFNIVNQTLSSLGQDLLLANTYYWLPTELNSNNANAWMFQRNSVPDFFSTTSAKNIQRIVRPIRRHYF